MTVQILVILPITILLINLKLNVQLNYSNKYYKYLIYIYYIISNYVVDDVH